MMTPTESPGRSIEELYEAQIKHLPSPDRFRLAQLIMGDIPAQSVIDSSDEWSDEDLADFSRQTWARAAEYVWDDDDA